MNYCNQGISTTLQEILISIQRFTIHVLLLRKEIIRALGLDKSIEVLITTEPETHKNMYKEISNNIMKM